MHYIVNFDLLPPLLFFDQNNLYSLAKWPPLGVVCKCKSPRIIALNEVIFQSSIFDVNKPLPFLKWAFNSIYMHKEVSFLTKTTLFKSIWSHAGSPLHISSFYGHSRIKMKQWKLGPQFKTFFCVCVLVSR